MYIYSLFPWMKNGKHNHKLKYGKSKKKTEVQIKFIYIDQLFSIYTSLQQRECGNGKESNETQFVVCVSVLLFYCRAFHRKIFFNFLYRPNPNSRQFFKAIALSMQFPSASASHA